MSKKKKYYDDFDRGPKNLRFRPISPSLEGEPVVSDPEKESQEELLQEIITELFYLTPSPEIPLAITQRIKSKFIITRNPTNI